MRRITIRIDNDDDFDLIKATFDSEMRKIPRSQQPSFNWWVICKLQEPYEEKSA